jgi:hypothetical protein
MTTNEIKICKMRYTLSHSFLFPVFRGRDGKFGFEHSGEISLCGKTDFTGNF